MAKLYFKHSPMNSGKSTVLLQVAYNYEERGHNVLLVKPGIDLKAGNKVQSRLGVERAVDVLLKPDDSLLNEFDKANGNKEIHCVLIDEAQFLKREQVDDAFRIAVVRHVPVLAYGLRTDFSTQSFEGSSRLLEIAHALEELKTICRCGKKAMFNARKATDSDSYTLVGEQVAIDGLGFKYESLCGECYVEKVGF